MKELKHAQKISEKNMSQHSTATKTVYGDKYKSQSGRWCAITKMSSIIRWEELLPLVSVFSYSSVASCDPWWLTPSFCNTLTNSGISFLRLFLALYWICPHSDVIGLICSMAVKRLSLVVGALLHAPFLRTGTWILCHIIIFLYSNQIVQCLTILAKPLLVSLS